MVTLVTGGTRSGKSRYALGLADRFARRAFIATAEPIDDEMRARIRRHREGRGRGYITVEEPVDLAGALGRLPAGTEVAVDIPSIKEVLGAKVGVDATAGAVTTLTYTGQIRLVFGFKAFGIAHVDGQWVVQGVKPSSELAFAVPGAASEDVPPVLFSESGRIALRGI